MSHKHILLASDKSNHEIGVVSCYVVCHHNFTKNYSVNKGVLPPTLLVIVLVAMFMKLN